MADADLIDRLARTQFAAQLVPSNPHIWAYLAESEKDRWRNLAKVAVDTLAEAGRLLPEGGETRQEWGSRPPGGGGVSIEDDEEDARKWCTRRPYRELVRRTVTVWPDGTQLVGSWQPLDAEGEHRG